MSTRLVSQERPQIHSRHLWTTIGQFSIGNLIIATHNSQHSLHLLTKYRFNRHNQNWHLIYKSNTRIFENLKETNRKLATNNYIYKWQQQLS